ncbi:MAG: PspA/IM30 family protein [Chloroflexota bacterium]
MPGLLDRVSTLVRANLNDLIDRAENPEKVIRQAIIDMNNQLIQVKTQVAASIADEQKLYQRWQENQALATDSQRKAELAVSKGRDDLAREALQRQNSYQQISDGFQHQYTDQKGQVETLKVALGQLEAKIQEADRKKDLLIARSRSAQAQQRIHDTLSGINTTGAMASFSRMEEKVSDQEARAKASIEMDSDSFEDRFAALEQGDAVDEQLAALKAKMGGSPALPATPASALPEGQHPTHDPREN